MGTAAKVHNLKSLSRIAAFSLQGQFALWSESLNRTLANSLSGTTELSPSGTFAPGNACSSELLLPGTFALKLFILPLTADELALFVCIWTVVPG